MYSILYSPDLMTQLFSTTLSPWLKNIRWLYYFFLFCFPSFIIYLLSKLFKNFLCSKSLSIIYFFYIKSFVHILFPIHPYTFHSTLYILLCLTSLTRVPSPLQESRRTFKGQLTLCPNSCTYFQSHRPRLTRDPLPLFFLPQPRTSDTLHHSDFKGGSPYIKIPFGPF